MSLGRSGTEVSEINLKLKHFNNNINVCQVEMFLLVFQGGRYGFHRVAPASGLNWTETVQLVVKMEDMMVFDRRPGMCQ